VGPARGDAGACLNGAQGLGNALDRTKFPFKDLSITGLELFLPIYGPPESLLDLRVHVFRRPTDEALDHVCFRERPP
jgi:hypothetical protein